MLLKRSEQGKREGSFPFVDFSSFSELEVSIISFLKEQISSWNMLPHGLEAELIIPENFTFEFANRSNSAEERKLTIKIQKKSGIFTQISALRWCQLLINSIEAMGMKLFFHRPQHHKVLKNKYSRTIGLAYELYPVGNVKLKKK